MPVDPKKLVVLVEDRMGRPSAGPVPLPSPSDVVYEPAVFKSIGKNCGNCRLWAEMDERCLLFPRDVPVNANMVCGYHVDGDPQLYVTALSGTGTTDPKLAGLITAPQGGTSCGRCRYYNPQTEAEGACRAVQKAGQPAKVEARGCCSRWAPSEVAEAQST